MLRGIATVLGVVLGAVGGVIAYRALFVDPSAAVVISNEATRELPNMLNVAGGILLLVAGAAIAFFAARRKSRS
jgi:protein-S-isoprenylcysteine O-methyltransferase Ste14